MFAAAALLLCTAGCRDEGVGRWVDPNIGGVAPLLTTVMPQVHRPHAMVRIYPVTEPGLNDRYFSDRIYGIAQKNNSLFEKTGINVIRTLSAVCLLHHIRY